MKKIILTLIKIYQAVVSPLLGRNCRFLPSCSDYCAIAIEKYGTCKGFWLFCKRLSHCHIFGKAGLNLP